MKRYLLIQSADGANCTTEIELPSGKRSVLATHLHSISAVGVAYDHANPGTTNRAAPAVTILNRDPYQIRLTWKETESEK